MDFNKK